VDAGYLEYLKRRAVLPFKAQVNLLRLATYLRGVGSAIKYVRVRVICLLPLKSDFKKVAANR